MDPLTRGEISGAQRQEGVSDPESLHVPRTTVLGRVHSYIARLARLHCSGVWVSWSLWVWCRRCEALRFYVICT